MKRPAAGGALLLALAAAHAASPSRAQASAHAQPERAARIETEATLAALARRPAWLALAEGATLDDLAHRRLLTDELRRRLATQSVAPPAEPAQGRQQATPPPPAPQSPAAPAPALPPPPATATDDPLPARDRSLTRHLAALPGPELPPDAPPAAHAARTPPVYRLPAEGRVLIGTGERSDGPYASRGIVLATVPGRPVLAPAPGRIRYAGPFRNYGDIVIVDHGHGWTTLIAGIEGAQLEVGSDVAAGAPLGRTTARLMAELRHAGRPVDIVGMAALLGR